MNKWIEWLFRCNGIDWSIRWLFNWPLIGRAAISDILTVNHFSSTGIVTLLVKTRWIDTTINRSNTSTSINHIKQIYELWTRSYDTKIVIKKSSSLQTMRFDRVKSMMRDVISSFVRWDHQSFLTCSYSTVWVCDSSKLTNQLIQRFQLNSIKISSFVPLTRNQSDN